MPAAKLVNALRSEAEDQVQSFSAKLGSGNSRSKKRVCFVSPEDEHERPRPPRPKDPVVTNTQSFSMLDLKTTESVCCHVSKVHALTSACQDGCVGYLDVSKTMPVTRFVFYDASKLAARGTVPMITNHEAAPISNVIGRFRILQQITLAHKLADAVLRYHSTSWLPRAWTLQDVAYFTNSTQTDTDTLSDALKSLHLSNRFPDHHSLSATGTQRVHDLKRTYGIRNLTLAKLGVALLEICAQKDIVEVGVDGIPHEIIKARELLDDKHHSIMNLGNRYLEIARKCVYCDFSCDDDLNSQGLQSAVYTEVVCALEDMKLDWEKFFGI